MFLCFGRIVLNLLTSVRDYTEKDLVDQPKTFKIEGFFDEGVAGGRRTGPEDTGWRMSATKTNTAITEGRDIEVRNSFIYDGGTLQRECDYRAKRLFSETSALGVEMQPELSTSLLLEKTVNVTIHPLGIHNTRWMINQREYTAGKFNISLVPYDPAWYVYSQQNLEFISNVNLDAITDFSHTRPSRPRNFSVEFGTGAIVIAGNDERAATAVVPLKADTPINNRDNITHLVFTATRDNDAFPFVTESVPVRPGEVDVRVHLHVIPGIVYDFECFSYNERNFFDENRDFREGFHVLISNVDMPDASVPRQFVEAAYFLSDSNIAPVIPANRQGLFGPPGGANWTIHLARPTPTAARPYVWQVLRIATYRDVIALTTESFIEATDWTYIRLVAQRGVASIQLNPIILERAYFVSDSVTEPVIPANQQGLFGPPGGPGAANWAIHTGLPFSTPSRPYVWRFVRMTEYTDISMLTVGTFVSASAWNSAHIITRHDSVQEGYTITEYAYFLSDVNTPPVIPDDQQKLFGPPGGPGAANWFIHQPQPPDPTEARPYVWRFARSAVYSDITMLTTDTFIRATDWEDSQTVRRNDNLVFGEYAYFLSDSDVAPVIPEAQQKLFGPPGGPGAANWFIHVAPPDPTEARPYVWRFERIATHAPGTVDLTSANFIEATDWDGEQLIRRLGFLVFIEYAYFLSDVNTAPVIPNNQQRLFGPPGGPGAANWTIHASPPDPTDDRPYVWRFERIATYTPEAEMLTAQTFISATDWDGEQRIDQDEGIIPNRSPIVTARVVVLEPVDDATWAAIALLAIRATNLGLDAVAVTGDVVTLHTSNNSYVQTRRYTGHVWTVPPDFVDGGTVIDGTVVNSKIASISAVKIITGLLTAGGVDHLTGILVQAGADIEMRGDDSALIYSDSGWYISKYVVSRCEWASCTRIGF